jgi:Ca2+-binding RTX toxin-like protein
LDDGLRRDTIPRSANSLIMGISMAIKFANVFQPNLFGGSSSDQLYGDGANNYISGGDGADYVNAGAGNDTINGGFGNDLLTGGKGSDTFQFGQYSGGDVITDFNPFQDHIELGSDVFIDQVQYVSGGTLITFGNDSGGPGAAASHPTVFLSGINLTTAFAPDPTDPPHLTAGFVDHGTFIV